MKPLEWPACEYAATALGGRSVTMALGFMQEMLVSGGWNVKLRPFPTRDVAAQSVLGFGYHRLRSRERIRGNARRLESFGLGSEAHVRSQGARVADQRSSRG